MNRNIYTRSTAILCTVVILTTIMLFAHRSSAQTDTTSQAGKLSIAELKTLAEEGFIYGLPIVMNYSVRAKR